MVLSRRSKAPARREMFLVGGIAATGGLVAGAMLEFFLDPRTGRRRRHTTRERAVSHVRRGERRAMRRARRAESRAVGLARRTINSRRRSHEPVDDVTLAHRVETELYRRSGVAKGGLSVNAEDGVVFLRGTVEHGEDIGRLEEVAREIEGVQAVKNLVHSKGTPAPASRSKIERERAG